MSKYLLIALLAVALAGGGLVWNEQRKVATLEKEQAALLVKYNALWRSNIAMADQRDISRAAADLANKERARVAVNAAKYETIRDAFRKGNFNAPLPDDFKLLISCLLWTAGGNRGERTDCP